MSRSERAATEIEAALLREFVAAGDWSEADAIRVVDLIARDNAARLYAV